METELHRIIELAQIAYDGGAYQEVWETLKQTYELTQSQEIKNLLLEMFYLPKREELEDNLRQNIEVLSRAENIYWGEYDIQSALKSLERIKILWINNGTVFYVENMRGGGTGIQLFRTARRRLR